MIRVFDSLEALAQGAAEELLARGREAVRARGIFTVALSGGGTPAGLYRRLRELLERPDRGGLDWGATHFFWGDERAVPPGHPDSNYRLAREAFLDHPAIPAANVHRIAAELGAEPAAKAYEAELVRFFALAEGRMPRFDVVLLGLGADGHTASLFPGTDALDERRRRVAAVHREGSSPERITLTFPVLAAARAAIFLVAGAEKAEIVRRVAGDREAELPAARVRPTDGELVWLLDRAAAAGLPAEGRPGGEGLSDEEAAAGEDAQGAPAESRTPAPDSRGSGKASGKGVSGTLESLKETVPYRVLKNLREVLTLIVFYLVLVGSPFRSESLLVTYELTELAPPLWTSASLEDAPTGGPGARRIRDLTRAPDLLRIELHNGSARRIEDLELQVRGAFHLADVGLTSSSPELERSAAELLEPEISDGFLLTFPRFDRLPPRSRTRLLLWGEFSESIFRPQVEVNSNASRIRVKEVAQASGPVVFFERNQTILGATLAMLLLLVGLRRFSRSRGR